MWISLIDEIDISLKVVKEWEYLFTPNPPLSIPIHSTNSTIGIRAWTLAWKLNHLKKIIICLIMALMGVTKEYHLDDELLIALEDMKSVELDNEGLK